MKIISEKLNLYVTHASTFDFQNIIYQPLRQSKLNQQLNIILPHEHALTPDHTKAIIKNCNIILAEVSFPSTGQGIELGWAEHFNKKIICCSQQGKTYSSSLKLITNYFFCYQNATDLIAQLNSFLEMK